MVEGIYFDEKGNGGGYGGLNPQFASGGYACPPNASGAYLPQTMYSPQMVNPMGMGGMLGQVNVLGTNAPFYNRNCIEFAAHADQKALDIQNKQLTEQIRTEAECERAERVLDLQTRHENKSSKVRLNANGCPIFYNEMLGEDELIKKVADISGCQSVLYEPNIYTLEDEVKRVLEVQYLDEITKRKKQIFVDVTVPDEHVMLKQIRTAGIQFLCGRRKQLEYALKLMEAWIASAETIVLPRYRGFLITKEQSGLHISYVPENFLTWEGVRRLCK